MGAVTYFVAMPFVRDEDGESRARRGARAAVGDLRRAGSRSRDPATGEFEDALVLKQFGEVPTLDELLSAT